MPDSQDSLDLKQFFTASDQGVLSRLNAVRLITVTLIAIGYASTMAIGPGSREWLNLFGYDPSLYGLQVLFFLSGWLAWRSLSEGRSGMEFIRSRAASTLPTILVYTALVAGLLYPVLCDHDAPIVKNIQELLLYFIKTVTLIEPGNPMPGALDGAPYPCLLQGTIWTLRWGVIAYAALLILAAFQLKRKSLFGIGLIIIIVSHIVINAWTDRTGSDALASIIPGIRLGMAFSLGIVVRQNMKRAPKTFQSWMILSVIFLGSAAVNYYILHWTYGIEILASAGWCALAMALLYSNLSSLKNWTNIVAPTYLGIWPITQVWLAATPSVSVAQLVIVSVVTSLLVAFIFRGLSALSLRPLHRRVQAS